jgi:hypothetical protein
MSLASQIGEMNLCDMQNLLVVDLKNTIDATDLLT